MARLGEAVEYLGEGIGSLGDAYEELDDQTADTLEEKLFGPMQRGYGRAKKTYADFCRPPRPRGPDVRSARRRR